MTDVEVAHLAELVEVANLENEVVEKAEADEDEDKITDYKISTITATGNLNVTLKLIFLYERVRLDHPSDASRDCGFSCVQFSNDKDNAFNLLTRSSNDSNGVPIPMQRSRRRKRRQTRHFDNQVTLIYWDREREKVTDRGVNVKVFLNGRVQMTGVRSIEEGRRILDTLESEISRLEYLEREKSRLETQEREKSRLETLEREKFDNLEGLDQKSTMILSKASDMRVTDYHVCLINSDFRVHYPISRRDIHDLLSRIGLVCSFDQCIYPGVKLSFMWNHAKTSRNEKQDGLCCCRENEQRPCNGAGNGYGKCRKITCAIFKSGCVIVTGAHNLIQLDDTYDFLKTFFYEQRSRIESGSRNRIP